MRSNLVTWDQIRSLEIEVFARWALLLIPSHTPTLDYSDVSPPRGLCHGVTRSRGMPVTMSRIVAWQRPDVVPPVSWPLLTLRASLSSGLSGSNSRAALPAFSLSLGHNSRSDTLQPHYIASLILHNSRTGQMGKQSESSIDIMWLYTINECSWSLEL